MFIRDRLSPDADGYEDFLEMQYTLPAIGYAASVRVFDAGGAQVKYLVRQDLLGTEGILRWEGDADDGTKVRPGIYVVYAEFFEPGGNVQVVKKAVSVVRRF
ncbi:MAG: hypothetical protein IPL65_13720 [Lewinellaceae bacterium]|nr:hypothetical protein [Lewinellaceae bacterium]